MNNKIIPRINKNFNKLENILKRSFFNDFFFDDPFFDSSVIEEFKPSSEFFEDEKNYYVEMDIPGMKKENIRVEFLNSNLLRIEGERKEKEEFKGYRKHFSESFYGNFTREFYLAKPIEEDSVEAKYEDGILKIIVPKMFRDNHKNKQIEIK
jgi:HSP20 family protein